MHLSKRVMIGGALLLFFAAALYFSISASGPTQDEMRTQASLQKIENLNELVERYGPGVDFNSLEVQLAERMREFDQSDSGTISTTAKVRDSVLLSLSRFQAEDAKRREFSENMKATELGIKTRWKRYLGGAPE